MSPKSIIISRVLLVLGGSLTAASQVQVWNSNSIFALLGAFVAGVAALSLPKPEVK